MSELATYLALGFLGVSLAVRSDREEFSFIIPYVRFRKDSVQGRSILLDSNVIIDGRLERMAASGFLNNSLIVPRFIVQELHLLAEAPEELKQQRGKRGLDNLQTMQDNEKMDVSILEESRVENEPFDEALTNLARELGSPILSNDRNLGKVARLRNVEVLNLHELSDSLSPDLHPGNTLELALVKEGKDEGQAVGYLGDGTMIVVNKGADHIGKTLPIMVSSSLQTAAGQMIFAEIEADKA